MPEGKVWKVHLTFVRTLDPIPVVEMSYHAHFSLIKYLWWEMTFTGHISDSSHNIMSMIKNSWVHITQ